MKSRKPVFGLIAGIVVLAAIIAVFAAGKIFSYHKDITGVTTLASENKVVMNSSTAGAFVSGEGLIFVNDGEMLHLEYSLSEGSFDIAFHADSVDLDVFKEADLENLTLDGEVFGASAISGRGSLDFAAAPGQYTVFYNMHETVGSATVGTE